MAIDVQTQGGATGTNPNLADVYYYSSIDPLVGTVTVTYEASNYGEEKRLLWMWYDTAPDSADDHLAGDGLEEAARTRIYNMNLAADQATFDAHVALNSTSTVYCVNSGSDTISVVYPLSDGMTTVGDPVPFYCFEYDKPTTGDTILHDTPISSGPIGETDRGEKSVILNTPSYIDINTTSTGEALYDGFRTTAGTSITISANTSQDFDISDPSDPEHLDWTISEGGSSLSTANGTTITFDFPTAERIYTVEATGQSDNATVTSSITISTVSNPGLCNVTRAGYIRTEREPGNLGTGISVGDKVGSNTRSINLFTNYITKSTSVGDQASLRTTAATLTASGIVQNTAGLIDMSNGIRFSEFFDLQAISGEVIMIGETSNRYGYFTTDDGVINVIVNCNTTFGGDVTVTVDGPRSSPVSISRTLDVQSNNFSFTNLDMRTGHNSDSSTAGETWTITITDNDTSETASININNPGSGVAQSGQIGTTFI